MDIQSALKIRRVVNADEGWVYGWVLNEERHRIRPAGESSIFGVRVISLSGTGTALALFSSYDSKGDPNADLNVELNKSTNMVKEAEITTVGTSSITLYKHLYYKIQVVKTDGGAVTSGNIVNAQYIV